MFKPVFSFLTIIIAFLSINMNAQKQDMQAFMSYGKFYAPGQGNYLEASLAVKGSSLTYTKEDNGNFRSKLQITMIFSRNDSVVTFEKYNLYSPEIPDTSDIRFNFIDQKRFQLDTGAYDFEIRLMDVYKDTSPVVHQMPVFIQFDEKDIEISTIQLVETYKKTTTQNSFSKNGMDIIPYMSGFFPVNVGTLTFYTEVYNTSTVLGDKEGYLINYYLESYESNEVMDNYSGFKRMEARPMNVFFHKFDIGELPTGNYNIVVELRNKKNEPIAIKKKFFQRYNPNVNYDLANLEAVNVRQSFAEKMDKDSLQHFIPALDPLANNTEKLFIRSELAKKDVETLQKFFLNFWTSRNFQAPGKAWAEYYQKLKEVEKFFGTGIKRGYETDRGRVYLQYGEPNSITERDHEPSSYPYEIWHYHQLTESQWNKKFVFYNPDLVTNDYELIHSNAIGEVYNPTWKYQLNKRNSITNDPYNNQNPDHWGSEAEDIYNNPY